MFMEESADADTLRLKAGAAYHHDLHKCKAVASSALIQRRALRTATPCTDV